ncbi:hypothetical protein IC582_027685 [Cucumis melo]
MGEEVKMAEYESGGGGGGGEDESCAHEERVFERETGLPDADDLTPLSQTLIPPELASAFSISTGPCRTLMDVNRASQNTLSNLRGFQAQAFSSNNFKSFNDDRTQDHDPMVVEGDEATERDAGSDSRKLRKVDCAEEADSALRTDNSMDDPSARTLKRPRLVWTPQLHKRFVDVVAHLGIKNAVPKTIMQLMNVEGLTRENVASHLQKYRLYLKRMQGSSNEGPSSPDRIFASTPVPQTLHQSTNSGQANGNGHLPVPTPMPYGPPMMPMPVLGMAASGHAHSYMGMPVAHPGSAQGYPGFETHPFNMMHQRDWSGNKYSSIVPYPHPHVPPNTNDK